MHSAAQTFERDVSQFCYLILVDNYYPLSHDFLEKIKKNKPFFSYSREQNNLDFYISSKLDHIFSALKEAATLSNDFKSLLSRISIQGIKVVPQKEKSILDLIKDPVLSVDHTNLKFFQDALIPPVVQPKSTDDTSSSPPPTQ